MMDRLTVKRPVTVFVRVTQGFRERVRQRTQRDMQQLKTEFERLAFREKQLASEGRDDELRTALRRRRQQLVRREAEIRSGAAQVDKLEDGDLLKQGTVEAEVDIAPGDSWEAVMNAAIIVQDGEVVEIRDDSRSR